MKPDQRDQQPPDSPAPGPESPLAEQAQHWLTRQRYPQFASIGLFNPADYWRVQTVLHEGPEAWQREAELLKNLDHKAGGNFPVLPKPLLQALARPFDEPNDHVLGRLWDDELDALSFGAFLLHPFFQEMQNGTDSAIVELAEDYQGEKASRRFGWHREALEFAIPIPQERLEALRRVIADMERPGIFRQRAIRWVPSTLPAGAELRTFLESVSADPDPLVKYWAAAHLVRIRLEDAPLPEWIYPALFHGLEDEIRPGMGCPDDEEFLAARTASLLDGLGEEALLRSLAFLENCETPYAEGCWEILLKLFVRHYYDEKPLADLRERWKAGVPSESQQAMARLRRQVRAIRAAAFALHPKLNHGAPENTTYGLNLDACIRELDLKVALRSPRYWMCLLPQRFTAELQHQQEHAASFGERSSVNDSRLQQARLHIEDMEKLDADEMAVFRRELDGAMLSATAEFLAQEREELSLRRFFGLEGYWNRHW